MAVSEPVNELVLGLGIGPLFGGDEGGERVEQMLKAAWTGAEPALLMPCWLRMATLLDDQIAFQAGLGAARALGLDEAKVAVLSEWPTHPLYSDAERVSIQLAEQVVFDVGAVEEANIDRLKDLLGDATTFNIVAALSMFDQCLRLHLVGTALLSEVAR